MRFKRCWCDIVMFLGLAGLVFGAVSCTSESAYNPIKSHILDVPHVNGFWVYDASGALIGSWGKPANLPHPVGAARVERQVSVAVYPAPASPATNASISFDLPTTGKVWLWVVRAQGPDDAESQIARAAGADYVCPGGAAQKVLLDGTILQEGFHTVDLEGPGAPASERLTSGFYRVYLVQGRMSAEEDIMYWSGETCNEIPVEFFAYFRCHNGMIY